MTVVTSLWSWIPPDDATKEDDFYFDGLIQASDGVREVFSDVDRFSLIGLIQTIAKECEGLAAHQKFRHDPTGRIVWVRHHLSRTQRDNPALDSAMKIMRDVVSLYFPSEL